MGCLFSQLAKHTIIGLSLIIAMCSGLLGSGWAYENLLFFETARTKAAYEKAPENYRRVAGSGGWEDVYVRMIPFVKIPMREIDSVVVEKEEVTYPPGVNVRNKYAYRATFGLRANARQKLAKATAKYVGRLVAIGFDDRIIAIAPLREPLSGDQFTTTLQETTEHQLRSLLAPLASKVSWQKPGTNEEKPEGQRL